MEISILVVVIDTGTCLKIGDHALRDEIFLMPLDISS